MKRYSLKGWLYIFIQLSVWLFLFTALQTFISIMILAIGTNEMAELLVNKFHSDFFVSFFCMIGLVLFVYGLPSIFAWAGMDLVGLNKFFEGKINREIITKGGTRNDEKG